MRKLVLILLVAVAAPRPVYADDVASPVKLLVGRSTVVERPTSSFTGEATSSA